MYNQIKNIFNDFIDFVLPSICLTCQNNLVKEEKFICLECIYDIFNIEIINAVNNKTILKHFYGIVPIKYAFSLSKFTQGSKIQALLYHLKYKNKPYLGNYIGQLYGVFINRIIASQYKLDKDKFDLNKIDLIIPIPLHKNKIKKRGYNQANLFAEGLSKSLSIPWTSKHIKRIKNTSSQTEKPTRWSKWINLENAFKVYDSKLLENKHLMLVDDVITSGSTLKSCASIIYKSGVRNISITTISFVETF